MKSTQEILALKLISIADGAQLGGIKELVINPNGGTLDYLILDQTSDYYGAKIVAFKDVQGAGEFAVTIASADLIQDLAANQPAMSLLEQAIKVIGAKVLTIKGTIIGEVTELYVDEENGKISKCDYTTLDQVTQEISAAAIVTYGKDLLIVNQAVPAAEKFVPIAEKVVPVVETPAPVPAAPAEMKAAEPADGGAKEGFNLFEQRQLLFFVGKKVTKDITLDGGELLPAGQVITDEIVSKIKTRPTLLAVSTCLEKG
ncbi:MAG: PRC-barrel domain-containing protein [Peptococcaceae bacterium]|jgi:uncharacterized protein YrrD|nr:PRC-barrel domain-containing protein [Peptococcaceae bacterium]